MLQYLLYFVVGGGLVALVAFLAQRGNATLTIMVANIPVMFLLNMLLTYKAGGVDGSLMYAKAALMYLPFYIIFVVITMFLIPRLGMPLALIPGSLVFIVPVLIRRMRARRTGTLQRIKEKAVIAGVDFNGEQTTSQAGAA
ncbi:MAG: hypothetical protein JW954_06030 [Dehalococcoidaceae bacterium]|nr:hypothetical protein [Dehalococcoidaceae bacterium]